MLDELTIQLCTKPVFIIGSPRSGTSALAWAIAEHPAFWTSGETDFLYHLFGQERLDEVWARSGGEGLWLQRHGIGRAEFMSSLGLGINRMISARSEGKRWVDQSPTYTAMADAIAELFPEALFLHIMRDGRNVVQSMINSGFGTAWAGDFTEACRTWAWFVDQAVMFGTRHPARYLAVPYQFLAESPQGCFRGILDFIDAEFNEGPGEFIRSRRINSSYQPDGPRDGEYRGPRTPWEKWDKDQRGIFVREAGRTFVEHRFGTEQELAA